MNTDLGAPQSAGPHFRKGTVTCLTWTIKIGILTKRYDRQAKGELATHGAKAYFTRG